VLKICIIIITVAVITFFTAPFNSFAQTSRDILLAQNTAQDSILSASSDSLSTLAPLLSNTRLKKNVSPSTSMYHSLALAGWGQRDNGKSKKSLLFIAGELFCVGGFIYEQILLDREGQTEYDKDVIRSNRNTFVIYWLCAKLFGMVDAYVDGQMKDFDVKDITPPQTSETENQPEKQ
jgi:hypothetical protein